MIESAEGAIQVIQNKDLPENERVYAIKYLRGSPGEEAVSALITALKDDDHGVRFAASEALADMGEIVMPQLLQALSGPANDIRLREGALRVLHNSSSVRVREESRDLTRVLLGAGAQPLSMKAASELMARWKK